MSKKEDFLQDLEALCKEYDVGEHEVEFSITSDGEEGVISVDIPRAVDTEYGVVWETVILGYRPFEL